MFRGEYQPLFIAGAAFGGDVDSDQRRFRVMFFSMAYVQLERGHTHAAKCGNQLRLPHFAHDLNGFVLVPSGSKCPGPFRAS